MGMFSRM